VGRAERLDQHDHVAGVTRQVVAVRDVDLQRSSIAEQPIEEQRHQAERVGEDQLLGERAGGRGQGQAVLADALVDRLVGKPVGQLR
jgi:hypothetical protein